MSSKAFPSAQIALRLRRLGYVVVVPSVSSFPDATLETMVYETRECLRWIKDEIVEFGGDRTRVWVLGHGAGAHVGLLGVVQSAVVSLREKELGEREERRERRRKREAEVGRDSLDGRESQRGKERSVVVLVSCCDLLELTFPSIHRHFSLDPFLDPYSRHASHSTTFDAHPSHRPHYASSSSSSASSSSSSDEADLHSISSAATLPFPAGVHSCRTFSGSEDEGRDQPETSGETLTSWDGMKIRGMILVGGVYDTVKQIKRESEMGLGEGQLSVPFSLRRTSELIATSSTVSSLSKVCGPTKSDAELARYVHSTLSLVCVAPDPSPRSSPCHLLYASSPLLTASPSSLPSKFLLIHGGADQVVPYSQSVLLKNLLNGVGVKEVRLRLYREETGFGSLASTFTPFSDQLLSRKMVHLLNDDREVQA